MLTYRQATTQADIDGILHLQKINVKQSLSSDEIQSQGFVTVNHTPELLMLLNDRERHIIATDAGKVVGYVLAMTEESRFDIPILIPMFEVFDQVPYKGKAISDYHYLVVGQVCIDKEYRGQGIFDACYRTYKEQYSTTYDFAITEIARSNPRSLNAHARIGFEEIHAYTNADGTEWAVVVWDWRQTSS